MRNKNRYIIRLILQALIITLIPGITTAFAGDLIIVNDDSSKEIASISQNVRNGLTSLTIRRNKKIRILKSSILDAPPRILYDLSYDGDPFPSVNRLIEGAGLKSVRIGYHPGIMRLVLDVNGTLSPKFFHLLKEHELVINLETGRESGVNNTVSSGETGSIPEVASQDREPNQPEEKSNAEKKIYTEAVVKEMMQKGELLLQKGKNLKALSIFEEIIQNYDSSSAVTEAEIGSARALFQMNSFQKSISMLAPLSQQPDIVSRYPDILLYLGYNYFQTRNYAGAKENLFGYYNISPENKASPLVLSRIGDIYRAEGAHDAAAKLYRLVQNLYPQTEGALISLTRLAELQENADQKTEKESRFPVNIMDDGTTSPRIIYENVIDGSLRNKEHNPMAEFAKLKLAILNRKEKNYAESLQILQELLKNYPRSKLQADIIYALNDTFEAVIEDGEEKEVYAYVVSIYEKERKRIERYAPPETFIAVARACLGLGLDEMAAELFSRADAQMLDEDKSLKYTADAYHFKGRMLLKKKEYAQAVEMFSQALKSGPGREESILIMVDKASALAEAGLRDESFAAAREAEKLLTEEAGGGQPVLRKIGSLYLNTRRPNEALAAFKRALESEKDEKERISLKFAIAGCYRSLGKKDEYTGLYKELATVSDPLWSRVAGEKMDALIFDEMLGKRDSRNRPSSRNNQKPLE
jgi:tetratricopeptide (TPR) repeat protein